MWMVKYVRLQGSVRLHKIPTMVQNYLLTKYFKYFKLKIE